MKYETFKALNCSRKHIIVCVQVFQIICIFFTCNRKIAHVPFYITGNRSRRYNMLFRPTTASKSLKEQHLKVKIKDHGLNIRLFQNLKFVPNLVSRE